MAGWRVYSNWCNHLLVLYQNSTPSQNEAMQRRSRLLRVRTSAVMLRLGILNGMPPEDLNKFERQSSLLIRMSWCHDSTPLLTGRPVSRAQKLEAWAPHACSRSGHLSSTSCSTTQQTHFLPRCCSRLAPLSQSVTTGRHENSAGQSCLCTPRASRFRLQMMITRFGPCFRAKGT